MTDGDQHVLIIDDEAQIRQFIRAGMELGGYRVSEAANGNDALREITEKAAAAAPKDAKKSKIEQAAAADLQKVGDFYASGMNEKAVDAARAKVVEALEPSMLSRVLLIDACLRGRSATC